MQPIWRFISFSSCYISPEIEEKIELEPQPKYLGCPEDFKVYSDYENHEIALSWSGVEGATHYEVEYESAVDYLSGKEMKKYITLTPSFSLLFQRDFCFFALTPVSSKDHKC